MGQLFNKCTAFTDIHWGKSGNSDEYNIKCVDFVSWFCEESIKYGADTCIFLGDWFDSRISIHVKTLNYALEGLDILSKSFKQVFLIVGNHDIYYRSKREVSSIEVGRNVENVFVIDHPIIIENVGLVPWLVGDEWKDVKKMKAKYLFGHLELPTFYMNARVEMPTLEGGLTKEDLTSPEYVFSGHFHKRQNKDNVWYIGNAFPQNYTDTNDDEKGMMFLDWGGKPTFKSWPNQPLFRQYNLSSIVNKPEDYIKPNINARVVVDFDLSYEESQLLRDLFINDYKVNDIKFIQKTLELSDTDWNNTTHFQSIDSIVMDGLSNLDEDSSFDKNLLVEIYNNL